MGRLGRHQVNKCLASPRVSTPSVYILRVSQLCWCGWSVDYLNDLWEWDGSTWTFRGGDTTAGGESDGGYSEPDASTEHVWPGKRSLPAVWSSDLGTIIFGGQTCTACSDISNRAKEVLSDMWLALPDESFTEWTWIRPAVDAQQQAAVAGISGRGIYSNDVPSSWPGARAGAGVWYHADPRANSGYMFGGLGYGASSYSHSNGRYQGKHHCGCPASPATLKICGHNSSAAACASLGFLSELWSISFETQVWTLVGTYNSRRWKYDPPGAGDWPGSRSQPVVWTTVDRHKTYIFGGLTTTSGACA